MTRQSRFWIETPFTSKHHDRGANFVSIKSFVITASCQKISVTCAIGNLFMGNRFPSMIYMN